jgi:hypothetical protein
MCVSLLVSFQALEDRREGDATVHFVQRGVKVLERSKWWFRGSSHGIQNLELDMVECMHNKNPNFVKWVCLAPKDACGNI